jgi:hypothetical protein
MFTCARSGDAILKPDFSLKEPRPLPWRLCQSILDTCNQAWLLFYDYLERAAHLLMPLRVDQMMRQFGGISLGADISLWWIGGVSCTSLHCKTEDIITYLLLVGFWWFQHRRLFYCWFASVGTQEMVGRATTGGERAYGSLEDALARIFSLSLVSVAVRKAVVDGWAWEARQLMLLGVGKWVQKVWGWLVWCGPSNEGYCSGRGVSPCMVWCP